MFIGFLEIFATSCLMALLYYFGNNFFEVYRLSSVGLIFFASILVVSALGVFGLFKKSPLSSSLYVRISYSAVCAYFLLVPVFYSWMHGGRKTFLVSGVALGLAIFFCSRFERNLPRVLVSVVAISCMTAGIAGFGDRSSDYRDRYIFSGQVPALKTQPNVHHILIDAYSGSNVLKRYEGFDNSAFIDELTDRGFRYLDVLSGYPRTHASMLSLWTMEYVDLSEFDVNTTDHLAQNFVFTPELPVFKIFSGNGYSVDIDLFSTKECKSKGVRCHHRFNIELPVIVSLIDYIFSPFRLMDVEMFRSFALGLGMDVPQISGSLTEGAPLFKYTHLTELIGPQTTSEYVKAVKAVNSELLLRIDGVLSEDPDAVIVISADHGSVWRSSRLVESLDAQVAYEVPVIVFGNSLAQCDFSRDAALPVNLYRWLFACLGEEQTEPRLLEQRSYGMVGYGPFGFEGRDERRGEVFELFRNYQPVFSKVESL